LESASVHRQSFCREESFYGAQWGRRYGGYFSDPDVAGPLIERLLNELERRPLDVIIDLGGGTGFILDQLSAFPLPAGVRCVNLEPSLAQLQCVSNPRIEKLQISILDFNRRMLDPCPQGVLFCSRSTLHYFGIMNLDSALHHLAAQMLPGESLIHQSLCCGGIEDALFLGELMNQLGSGKWVLPAESLGRAIAKHGFKIEYILPAAALEMSCAEMSARYRRSREDVERLVAGLAADYPLSRLVFAGGQGLTVAAPYSIFGCRRI